MFGAQHLHHTLPSLRAFVLWQQDPPLLPLCDPPHRRPEFPAEHQAMVCLSPMLRGFFPADGGEVLCAGPQRVLHEHCVLPRLPSAQALLDPSMDVPVCRDMAGPLERHHLKDDKTTRVPPSVAHPLQLPHQGVDVPPPHLPARRFVASRWHDRKVMPPPLPRPVIRDPAVQMCDRVSVDPVSVDLPET